MPEKKGYKFIEWQLNGEKFDFNKSIEANIKLIAKWEKIENSNNASKPEETQNNTPKPEETQNTNQNNNSNPQNNQNSTPKPENTTKEISISNITINNTSDKYLYSLTKKEIIKVTITGKKDLINNINENNIKLYVDASGLDTGTHNVDIKISNINSNLTYIINPTKTNINITKKINKENTINLNENVEYYEGESCGGYQAIKNSCINKTYRELMNEYPINTNSEVYNSETLNRINLDDIADSYLLVEYFPDCKTTVSADVQNTINKIPGFHGEFRNDGFMAPYWIYFANEKYNKFKETPRNFEKYGIYDITICGGPVDIKYLILNETICKKYNLSCDRW